MAFRWCFEMRFDFCLPFCLFCQSTIGLHALAETLHLPQSSKMLTIAKNAQKELNKGSSDGVQAAIILLEDLSSDPSFRRLQPDVKIDIYNMLINAYECQKYFTKENALITTLLRDEAFKPYWINLKALMAKSMLAQDMLHKAQSVMKELLRTPKRRLSAQDADIVTSLYTSIQHHAEKKLRSAEILFQQKEYVKAATIYQYLYDATKAQVFPQTLSKISHNAFLTALSERLAVCYFLDEDYEQCLKALADSYKPCVIRALAEKRLSHLDAALIHFEQSKKDVKTIWEACFSAYKSHDIQKAKELLQELPDSSGAHVLEVLINMEEANFIHAEKLIQANPNSYLQGLYHLHLGLKETACEHLEKAIQQKGPYQKEALIVLGATYLELASSSVSSSVQEVFLDRAEALVSQPIDLAKIYFLRKDSAKLQKLEQAAISDDVRYEIGLYIADLTGNFDAVCDAKHLLKQSYPKALVRSCKQEHIDAAFRLLVERKQLDEQYEVVEELLLYLINNNQPEKACRYLEIALPELTTPTYIEKSHWLYAISSVHTTSKAIWLCEQFLQKYPDSPYFADVVFHKALASYKADDDENALEALSLLEAEYPHSSHRDEVLFFMGCIYQKRALDARPFFHEVFTDYPQSPYGPESYYRYYSEQEYSAHNVQAIAHLKKMPPEYAPSYFGVMGMLHVAAYDLESSPQNSISGALINTLTTAIENGKKLFHTLAPKMRSRFCKRLLSAEYELAQGYYILAQYPEAQATSDTLKHDVFDLKEEERPHGTWLKASFLKSRTLLLQGNENQAREELVFLLNYAEAFECNAEEPVILALIELSKVAAKGSEYEQAFDLLNKAQKLQAYGARSELLLEILIAKALIHKQMGESDKAMMLLSQVINEQSASSLRIQAMFLRAELYELKGRRDLAFRQLQATAKKGGEWGMRARKKLEEKYGYG